MSALRVARAATGRDLVVKFAGAYHGHSDGLLVEAGSGLATQAIAGSAGRPRRGRGDRDRPAVQRPRVRSPTAFAGHPGQIAAVIVEPVVANAGVIPPDPGFLEHLRDVDPRRRRPARLRRGHHRVPARARRRAGAVRRHARPDDARQDHRRRHADRGVRRPAPISWTSSRRRVPSTRRARCPATRSRWRPGSPRSPSCRAGAATSTLEDVGRRSSKPGLARGGDRARAARSRSPASGRCSRSSSGRRRRSTPAEALASDRAAYARFFGAMLDQGILLPPSQFEAWFVSMAHGAGRDRGHARRRARLGVRGMNDSLPAGVPPRAGRRHAGLVHAPGRPVASPRTESSASGTASSSSPRRRSCAPRSRSCRSDELGVDAAVLFADIMLPLEPMGVDLRIEPERRSDHRRGRSARPRDVAALRPFDPAEVVLHARRDPRSSGASSTARPGVIGFSGAPFTLACYLIEGRPSRDFATAKAFMYREPGGLA